MLYPQVFKNIFLWVTQNTTIQNYFQTKGWKHLVWAKTNEKRTVGCHLNKLEPLNL